MSRCCSCQEDLRKLMDDIEGEPDTIPEGIYNRVASYSLGRGGLSMYLDKGLGWSEERIKRYMTTPNPKLRDLSPNYIEKMGYQYITILHFCKIINNLEG